jgi:predicted ATPase
MMARLMTPERYQRVEEVFGLAIEREGEARARLLDEACGDDVDLRREVEALLAEHDRASRFLAEPARATTALAAYTQVAAAPPAPLALEAGAVVDGKYRVEALVGRGGMGEVYRATQLSLDRAVALKVIRSDLATSPAMLAQFRREAHAVARLRHPNIVTVHEYGLEPGLGAYIIMEHLEGRSLRHELGERGRLAPDEAAGLVRQVCDAVGAAHQAGVVHRDLKPDNVFLEPSSGGRHVKVLDFGIAKIAAVAGRATGELTIGGAILGTPAYMAPEQASGGEVDGRSDVYALGCLLYELVTGRPPFVGGTSARILEQHLAAAPRPPRDLAPDIPAWLDDAIVRALSKDPGERFQTAEELMRALGAGAPAAEPPQHNLPTFVVGFVGRQAEIAAVSELLAAGRLVTLLGPGGIGKTRLAVEAAAAVRDRFAHGAWLVELAALADPRLVTASVAAVFGVREQRTEPLATTLVEALRGRDLLLVLDNCEHLVGACAEVAAGLLHACPGLRVLATSREALGVEGEVRYEVPSLGLPDEAAPFVGLAESEAVRLFVERAQSVRPGFALTEREAPAVAAICRRLDGIPLAIELAAARARSLSVEQLLERLRDRFRLLAGIDRTALPRHQTLRAAVDWSYELLSDEERKVFRRLSVFAGGWTLEAAEEVVSGQWPVASEKSSLTTDHWPLTTSSSPLDTLDLLARLVDKSLVRVEECDGALRYGMLETIREYAWERLAESGEAEAALGAHRAWVVALAERARRHWQGPEEGAWIARLGQEHDNLRAVLQRERGEGSDPQRAVRLCTALTHFWVRRSHIAEGRRWLEAAMAAADRLPAPERASAVFSAGQLAAYDGDLAAAETWLDESAAISRSLGDEEGLCRALGSLATVLVTAGEYDRAGALAAEALSLARALGDWQRVASALLVGATLAVSVGRYAEGEQLLGERLAICRDRMGEADVVVTLLQLSGCVGRLGRLDEAEALLDECEDVAGRSGLAIFRIYALGQRGLHALWRGNAARAVELLAETLARFWELKYMAGVSAALDDLMCSLAAIGSHREAMRTAGAAAALREAMGTVVTPQVRADFDLYLGLSRRALGDEAAEGLVAEGRAMALDAAVSAALDAAVHDP